MKDGFYKNSMILTLSNLTTGILGFIFSIYLSKILGPEGMGLYGLVMPIYNLFICLMTAGVIAAISKISAIYASSNDYNNLTKTIRTVAFFNFIWAMIVGILVFFFSPTIGHYWVKDSRTMKAIMVTCPAMIFIALSNILKGYFYGTSKISMPAFIDILEKAFRIFVLALLIYIFKADSLEKLVTLAYISICYGEFQSLALLYFYYKFSISKHPKIKTKTEGRAQLLFDVLIVSVPLCLNGFIISIFTTIATLIVPRRLVATGFQYSEALSMIGKYSGMALAIVTFPMIIIASINTLLIPDLSQTMNKKDHFSASKRIKEVISLAFIIGLCTLILGQTFSSELGKMFFSRNDLGGYIKASSLAMPLFFTSVTMFGILNGLGKQTIILRNNIITEILEILCLYVFTGISSINVFGFAITMFIISTLSLILNLYEVNKQIALDFSFINILIYILAGILCYLLLKTCSLNLNFLNFKVKIILSMLLCFGMFSFLLLTFRKKNLY
ncbi:stage V sporulation protein B [Clostridium cavendishii DSM 21758]|uniref:Multidrug-efflux transporter n=1 Tax=Clostridium cavendishii DSM 21758 TaxID=1121302 RepID=A0A1M6EN84_9CLOT|nr:stage V sporulation protein B [Clostridium cavendishii]SHI86839.1 stage V sporulation protein B [Clostridium cavendishii DSM 21758]